MDCSRLIAAGLALALCNAVGAQEERILIGQTGGFTGPVAPSVKEMTDGARAYFDAVNRSGGVHGRRIELVPLDDKFDPKLAGENCRALVLDRKVYALFLVRGTPHTEACLPVVKQAGVPLVAPSTGAHLLHDPVNPLVFNVRAQYQSEVMEGVRFFATTGITRLALVHVGDSFGRDVLDGFKTGLARERIEPAAVIEFDRVKMDMAAAADAAIRSDPQAIIIAGSAAAVVRFTQEIRKQRHAAQIMTLSNNSSASFIKSLGELAPGMIISQITPAPTSRVTGLGKEMMQLAAGAKIEPSYAAMEGLTAAKVLVEGLRRAGPNASPRRFAAALESIRNWDMGGIVIDYSPTDHTGAAFVELSIVGQDMRLVR